MNDPELPGTVLRLPATYGPGDRQHRLFEYLKTLCARAGACYRAAVSKTPYGHVRANPAGRPASQ